ncbi:MAG TPA: hypothetical protein VNO70_09195 [Blastocatellia bacterium]|nr:hypothetical protein [Blastocatellia bacterium]
MAEKRDRRDKDMANVAESMADMGDKTAEAPGGNIPGGSGGVQGHPDRSDEQEARSNPHEESRIGARHKGKA